MRRWLRDPLPEIPEKPEIPQMPERHLGRGRLSGVSGISGISGISGSAVRSPPPVEPDRWPLLMRGAAIDGVQLKTAADILESLMAAGVIDAALRLGWDVRELIGLHRFRPHDHPLHAGLIFSLRPGDIMQDVSRAGCIIAYGNVRHIWRRRPLDASIMLPWNLAAWLAERGNHAA